MLLLGAVFPQYFVPEFHYDGVGNVVASVETLIPLRVTQATLLVI
jgi:hypothetical protein